MSVLDSEGCIERSEIDSTCIRKRYSKVIHSKFLHGDYMIFLVFYERYNMLRTVNLCVF